MFWQLVASTPGLYAYGIYFILGTTVMFPIAVAGVFTSRRLARLATADVLMIYLGSYVVVMLCSATFIAMLCP